MVHIYGYSLRKEYQLKQQEECWGVFKSFHAPLKASGGVTVYEVNDENTFKVNNFIGYYDDNYYYLITDIVHKAVKKLCFEQDENFSLSKNSLLKHLLDDGYIQGTEQEKTKIMHFNGQRQRYMVLDRTKADYSSE
jgi:hypothetical protein